MARIIPFVFCVLAVLSLNSCRKDGDSGTTPAANSRARKSGESHGVRSSVRKYEFVVNGCSTGAHVFDSETNGDVQRKYCAALQDEELNHGCAFAERREFFRLECPGTWTPKFATRPVPAPMPEPIPVTNSLSTETHGWEATRIQTLQPMFMNLREVSAELSGEELAYVTQAARDYVECGTNHLAPGCGTAVIATHMATAYVEQDARKKRWFHAGTAFGNVRYPLLIVLEYSRIARDSFVPVELRLYRVQGESLPDDLLAWLADSTRATLVATLEFAQDPAAAAAERLAKSFSLRELHRIVRWMRQQPPATRTANRVLVSDAVRANLSRIHSPDQAAADQLALVEEVSAFLKGDHSLITELAEGFLKHPNAELRALSAVILLEDTPYHRDAKAGVIEALESESWSVRKRAVKALASATLNVAEQIHVLKRIGDRDADVQNAALEIVKKMNLTEAHVPALRALSEADSWEVRRSAVRLLAGVTGSESRAALVARLADPDQDVREAVMNALETKVITADLLPQLERHLKASDWSVRKNAVRLVARVDGTAALRLLIAQMSDADTDVRAAVEKALKSRRFSERELSALTPVLSSSDWSVRRAAVKLVGLIPGDAAALILIGHMGDSDDDVRKEVFTQLDSQRLTKALVPALVAQFRSSNWAVREHVAELLGKITGADSVKALEKQLAVESDQDVVSALKRSLKKLRD